MVRGSVSLANDANKAISLIGLLRICKIKLRFILIYFIIASSLNANINSISTKYNYL